MPSKLNWELLAQVIAAYDGANGSKDSRIVGKLFCEVNYAK